MSAEACAADSLYTKDEYMAEVDHECTAINHECYESLFDGFIFPLNANGNIPTDEICSGYDVFQAECTAEEFDEFAALYNLCKVAVAIGESCPAESLHTKDSYASPFGLICSECYLQMLEVRHANQTCTDAGDDDCIASCSSLATFQESCEGDQFADLASTFNWCEVDVPDGEACPAESITTKESWQTNWCHFTTDAWNQSSCTWNVTGICPPAPTRDAC